MKSDDRRCHQIVRSDDLGAFFQRTSDIRVHIGDKIEERNDFKRLEEPFKGLQVFFPSRAFVRAQQQFSLDDRWYRYFVGRSG